ncbi:MAG: efflux RND transporter permease subunit [Prochlorothrix sp.]|nr:efflux RND transporter permease subunit [Prochlorothrix sp.]
MSPPRPPRRPSFSLSRFALNHPWLTISFWIAIAVAGLFAFSSLKYALFPDVTFPIVVVDATVPLEDVLETEAQLTNPLEEWLMQAGQLKSIASTTYSGRSVLQLSFQELGTTLKESSQEVEYLLGRAMAKEALPNGTSYRIVPFNLNESAAISYILRGADRVALYEQASTEILPVLRKFKGVLRVELLGAVDLVTAEEDSGDTPFGGPTLVRFNGEDAIAIQVVKEGEANTLEVVAQVEEAMAELQRRQPDLEVELAVSQAEYIREATQATIDALIQAVILAVLIIFPFLGSWRATLITALAIPVSLLGTCIAMAMFGFNLETITLLALALVIGIIVDDAIVDVENIVRHIEGGESPRRAAFHATQEIGLTVSAATLTIVAVFLPVALMGGVVGQFFKPFGLTVSVAVVTSLLAARTLSPVLAAFWLRRKGSPLPAEGLGDLGEADQGTGARPLPDPTAAPLSRPDRTARSIALSDSLEDPSQLSPLMEPPQMGLWRYAVVGYRRVLTWALGARWVVIVLAIASLGAGIALIPLVPQGFIPQLDRGDFNLTYEISPSYLEKTLRSKFEAMQEPGGNAGENAGEPAETAAPASVGEAEGEATAGATGAAPQEELQGYAALLQGLNEVQLETLKALGRRAVRSHVVRPREDLEDIAERYLGSRERWTVLARINRRNGPTDIKAGESIVVLDLPPEGIQPEDMAPEESPEAQFAPLVLAESRTIVQQIEPIVQGNPNVESVYTILGERGAINKGRLYIKLRDDRDRTTVEVQDQLRSALPNIEGISLSVEDIKFVDTGGEKPLKVAFRGENLEDLTTLAQTVKQRLLEQEAGLADITATGDDQAFGGRQEVEHLEGDRVAYIWANLAPGQALGEATDRVVSEAQRILPPGVTIELRGDSGRSTEVLDSFLQVIGLSVIAIALLLLLLFRRLLDPLVVILALPLSIVGAVLALLITRSDFGMVSILGMIFLMGLVNKNVIILVDYTNQLRRMGLERNQAVLQSGPVRLRPIVMTTLSTILGMMPIALGWGAGAELRQPMAVAIIGGLIADTILSLLVAPVLYTLVDDVQTAIFGGFRRKPSRQS